MLNYNTTPFQLQNNGQAERTNQTIKTILRIAAMDGLPWFAILYAAELAINSASFTGSPLSPLFLNYGFHLCHTTDAYYLYSASHDVAETRCCFVARLEADWKAMQALQQRHSTHQADRINTSRTGIDFQVGDLVYVDVRTVSRPLLAD